MSNEEQRLEPCPFCGAVLVPYETHRGGETFQRHPASDCVLSDLRLAPEEIERWNTRAPLTEHKDELVERVAAIVERALQGTVMRADWRHDLGQIIAHEVAALDGPEAADTITRYHEALRKIADYRGGVSFPGVVAANALSQPPREDSST